MFRSKTEHMLREAIATGEASRQTSGKHSQQAAFTMPDGVVLLGTRER